MKLLKWATKLAIYIAFSAATFATSQATDNPSALETHMYHWLRGSAEWRTDNPGYNPAAVQNSGATTKEFAVTWKFGPNKQHLVGEISAISVDGHSIIVASMYAFYNPSRKLVRQVVISRSGTYSVDETPVRATRTPFGEPEIGIAVEYKADGTIQTLKHENTFFENGIQHSDVYEKKPDDTWELQRRWIWKLLQK